MLLRSPAEHKPPNAAHQCCSRREYTNDTKIISQKTLTKKTLRKQNFLQQQHSGITSKMILRFCNSIFSSSAAKGGGEEGATVMTVPSWAACVQARTGSAGDAREPFRPSLCRGSSPEHLCLHLRMQHGKKADSRPHSSRLKLFKKNTKISHVSLCIKQIFIQTILAPSCRMSAAKLGNLQSAFSFAQRGGSAESHEPCHT